MNPDYALILNRKYKEAEWSLNGDDYDGLTWLTKSKKPTKEELDEQWAIVLKEIEQEKADLEAKKVAALAKLDALGLVPEDLRALGL